MRPSWSRRSSVSRAISRRTPSKPESRTAPGGVAPGLLLHLTHEPRALVAKLVLQLTQEDLLGLGGAEPGEPLELAYLLPLRLLQLLPGVIEIALPIGQRALPLGQLARLQFERLLLGPQPFFEPGDLGPARDQLLHERLAPGHGGPAVAGSRPLGSGRCAGPGLDGAGALRHQHHRH